MLPLATNWSISPNIDLPEPFRGGEGALVVEEPQLRPNWGSIGPAMPAKMQKCMNENVHLD